MTRAEFEEEQRLTLTRDAVAKAIGAGATVSEKDVKAYYDSHKQTFTTPKHRQVREIRVARVELAQSLYAKLQRGADFAALARKYSRDTFAAKGGEFTAIERVGTSRSTGPPSR